MALTRDMARRIAPGLMAGLALCAPAAGQEPGITYLGIETRLLGGDLVTFRVALKGAPTDAPVIAYAKCAAAQYALIRGYDSVRHVRTALGRKGGAWRADAAYMIRKVMPGSDTPADARATVEDCAAKGIPTV